MTAGHKLPKSLSHSDFQRIADRCYDVASRAIRRGESVEPALIGGTVDNGKLAVRFSGKVPMANDQDKEAVILAMQALVECYEVDFVATITEAWMLATPDGKVPEGSIAGHPKREEVVVFNIMSKDCQTVVVNPLRRNPSRLKRGKVDFTMKVKGRMVREPETRN